MLICDGPHYYSQETIDTAIEKAKEFHKHTKDLLNYNLDDIIELSQYGLSENKYSEQDCFFDPSGEHQDNIILMIDYIIYGYISPKDSTVVYCNNKVFNPYGDFDRTSDFWIIFTEQPEVVMEKYSCDNFTEKITDNLYMVIEKDIGLLYDIQAYNNELNAQYASEKQDDLS